jgi:hypothetical protein
MGSSSYDRSFATHGVVVVADTSELVTDFIALCAIGGNAVISTITLQSGSTGGSDLAGVELIDGIPYVIPGTAITLTSGTVIVYKA